MLYLDHISKKFGALPALQQLEMYIPDNAVYGLVGTNGSGKTTALQVICGLIEPDSGAVIVRSENSRPGGHEQLDDKVRRNEREPRDTRARQNERETWDARARQNERESQDGRARHKPRIGYVPQHFGGYRELEVQQYLEFFAGCYGLSAGKARRKIREQLAQFELRELAAQRVIALTPGQRQKLALARALLHDPELLVLDEPDSGLDPASRIEFRQQLSELAMQNKTILIASHLLSDISELCTHIGIMDQGRMLMEGELSIVQTAVNMANPIVIRLAGRGERSQWEKLRQLLRQECQVRYISFGKDELQLGFDGGSRAEAALLHRLIDAGLPILSFSREKGSLEGLFMKLTQNQEERRVLSYEAWSDIQEG